VAEALGAGLEKRPETKPREPRELDRYERLIEATRLAGREEEAFELFWYGLGHYTHLGWVLGEYDRGYRVVAAFSRTGRPEDLATRLGLRSRSLLANDLALFAQQLGLLAEARAIRRLDDAWKQSLADPIERSIGLRNSGVLALALGRLPEAHALAAESLAEASVAGHAVGEMFSLALRATAAHALGDISAAHADFADATERGARPLVSLGGLQHARHHLKLGQFVEARERANDGLAEARRNDWNEEVAWFHALLGRIELAEGGDPTPHVDEIRDWTSRTGEMEFIIEAHVLAASHLLALGDPQAALGEAQIGLLHAESCGYGLLRIELLIALARIRLAWPDAPEAIRAARQALDLAAQPGCGYAWGEADASQVWGEAFFSNREFALARRAFERALEVRRRIEHPGTSETERWLARLP